VRKSPGAAAVRALGAAALVLALATAAPAARSSVPAWTTYDHDAARSATDPDSGSPVAPSPAWGAPATLDGAVYAQPLVYGPRVYVATENNTIYALDAATGAVVWVRNVGSPVPSGDLPCGNISPTVGITGTPSIDPAGGRIYAVADELVGGAVAHRLVALDLATGKPVSGFPISVDPPGADPKALLQRASLTLDGGRVIVPYGGNSGDCSTYHGWLVSAAQDGSGTPSTFEVDSGPGEHGGAIWGSGAAPPVDAAGHLFASTGNGFGSTVAGLQESVVELDPSLNLVDHWTASNWQQLDSGDQDLGSTEPVLLPNGLLFAIGKDGVGRLLSATALGTAGQLFSAAGCSSGGAFGASLYRAGVLYVPCSTLNALSVSTSGASPSFTALAGWSPPSAATGPPIYAGGLVWSTGWRSAAGSQMLYGLDAATGHAAFQTTLGTFDHFAAPSAAGGRLFVAAGATVTALTIASPPPPTATSTALVSSANPAPRGASVTLTATVAPGPDAGTISFSEAGAPLTGCGAVAVAPVAGTATCIGGLAPGTHRIVATYSGDPYYVGSRSTALTETALGGPRVSGVGVKPRRFTARRGTTLRLKLSEAARLRVRISRRLPGHVRRGRCRTGARKGRRCTITSRSRKLNFRCRPGRNRLRLELAGLPAGRYVATVVARDSAGRSSKAVTVSFQILARRR
jgi:outer membrane protein assembly factor BamB